MKFSWLPADHPARLEGPCRVRTMGGPPWPDKPYIVIQCTYIKGDFKSHQWNVLRVEDLDEGADLDVIKANLCVLAECKIGEMHGTPTT